MARDGTLGARRQPRHAAVLTRRGDAHALDDPMAPLVLPLLLLTAHAQRAGDPIDRIREADLKADLFALAGDAMRGREGGTLDEMTASAWVAERAREAGLQPAGDNGTYFQFFPLERFRVSASSTVTLGGKALRMGRDVVHRRRGARERRRAGHDRDAGRAEPLTPASAVEGPRAGRPLRAGTPAAAHRRRRSGPRAAQCAAHLGARHPAARRRSGAAAIVALVPDAGERAVGARGVSVPARHLRARSGRHGRRRGRRARHAAALRARVGARRRRSPADARLVASIFTDSFTYPSVNVIAKVPGRDPKLRDEYVLFSAHQDHDGERYTVNGDKIWNGADDNATTSVALLAIGRAMAAQPARRSALFIWHGAEERGLMGSRWYVKHPTVPLKSIVAVPQRRHDRPQRSEDRGAARRAAAASQLAGARGDGARREQGRSRSSRSIRRGTIRSTARAGTTAAITCRTRAPASRRCSSRRCCTPTTTRRSTTRIGSTSPS